MSSESAVTPHSILEKFEFYFLGLTFTLLGAAIQTAAFTGHSHVSVITEIIGWAGFAISGRRAIEGGASVGSNLSPKSKERIRKQQESI